MDCKIILRVIVIIFIITTPLKAIEFKGKFLQGHFIIGITDPSAQIIIGKKRLKSQKMDILYSELIEIENLI